MIIFKVHVCTLIRNNIYKFPTRYNAVRECYRVRSAEEAGSDGPVSMNVNGPPIWQCNVVVHVVLRARPGLRQGINGLIDDHGAYISCHAVLSHAYLVCYAVSYCTSVVTLSIVTGRRAGSEGARDPSVSSVERVRVLRLG